VATKKKRQAATSKKSWPGVVEALRFARESLAQLPCAYRIAQETDSTRRARLYAVQEIIQRADPVGERVASFVLPLDYCPPLNVLTRKHWTFKGKLHDKVFSMLVGQHGFQRPNAPLGGRPLVRFVRFSVTLRQDRDASWTKVPLDVLVPTKTHSRGAQGNTIKQGMGFIRDDNQRAIDLQAWWEPGDSRHQFVYLDIWTGER